MSWRSEFCRAYALKYPLMNAGIPGLCCVEVTIAISRAGGLGILGYRSSSLKQFEADIQHIRAHTPGPFGVSFFFGDGPAGQITTRERVDVAARLAVPVAVFHHGLPPVEWVHRLRLAGVRVWQTVASCDDVLAGRNHGFDALVVQGSEAAGPNRSLEGIASLLPQVRTLTQLPLIAFGGAGCARNTGALFVLGASAAMAGTRFIAASESGAHDEYKHRLVNAVPSDTVAVVGRGPEFPGLRMRVIRNRAAGRLERGEAAPQGMRHIGVADIDGQHYRMPVYSQFFPMRNTHGDFEEMMMPAGAGVAFVRKVEPAASIVRQLIGIEKETFVGAKPAALQGSAVRLISGEDK